MQLCLNLLKEVMLPPSQTAGTEFTDKSRDIPFHNFLFLKPQTHYRPEASGSATV
jgi:hypothetical protein